MIVRKSGFLLNWSWPLKKFLIFQWIRAVSATPLVPGGDFVCNIALCSKLATCGTVAIITNENSFYSAAAIHLHYRIINEEQEFRSLNE